MLKHPVVHLGGYSWCMFPWLGTRSFRTIRKFLAKNGAPLKISGVEFEGCYYITFRMEMGNGNEIIRHLNSIVERDGINTDELVGKNELPMFEKYDEYIPAELLRRAYATDRLRADEPTARLADMIDEIDFCEGK
jgi:ATP-dependent Lhr-like helicase